MTFAVLAGVASAEDASLADTCSPGCSPDAVSGLATLTALADAAWITGALAAATGLVLLFALPPEGERPSAALAPFVTPTTAGLVAAGRF